MYMTFYYWPGFLKLTRKLLRRCI